MCSSRGDSATTESTGLASSYEIDFTCFIARVCVDLSSPTSVIWEGELAVMMPVRRLPSRIKTVACGASAAGVPLLEHEARNPTNKTKGAEMTKKRGMRILRYKDTTTCPRVTRPHGAAS